MTQRALGPRCTNWPKPCRPGIYLLLTFSRIFWNICVLIFPWRVFFILVPYQYLCMYLRQYWLNVYFWRLFQKKVYKCQWFFSWRYTPNMWHVLYRIHVMKLYPKHDQILRHYICTPNSIETKLIACEIGFLPKIWKPMIFFSCLSFLQNVPVVPASYFRFSLWFWIKYDQCWFWIFFSGPRFRLIYAVKPHTEKVTMVSLQTEASLIVTASQDCTLFFFRFATTDRGIDMDPIRCITLEHVAINFEWISLQVLLVHFYEEK